MARQNNFKYEIVERIAEIGRNDDGVSKQLNLISYNGYKAKYDVRSWNPDGTMGKGVTLTEDEALALASAIANYVYENNPDRFKKAIAAQPIEDDLTEKELEDLFEDPKLNEGADIVPFKRKEIVQPKTVVPVKPAPRKKTKPVPKQKPAVNYSDGLDDLFT